MKKIFSLFAAVLVAVSMSASISWVKTDITSLSNGDVVVVLETAKYNKALLNTEATSSGSVKASSTVTLSDDGTTIDSEVAVDIQWVFGISNGKYTFKSNDSGQRQLWCRDNNDALRVKSTIPGEDYDGTFTWDATYKMLKSASLTRYVGVWKKNETDYQWRAYNSQTGTNINGTQTSFYKKVETSGDPEIDAPSNVDITAAGESNTVTVQYEMVDMEAIELNLYSDEACETAFTGDWFTAELDAEGNISYEANANTTYAERVVYGKIHGLSEDAEDVYSDIITFTQAGLVMKYEVLVDDKVEHGSISASVNEAAEGEEVTLLARPDDGYALSAWVVTDSEENPVSVTNNKFNMPVGGVFVSATFIEYRPRTRALVAKMGDIYYAMTTSAGSASNTMGYTEVILVGDKVYPVNGNTADITWNISASSNGKEYIKTAAGKYLSATSSTNLTVADAACEWTINDEKKTWTIVVSGSSTVRSIVYREEAANKHYFRAYGISNCNTSGYADYTHEYEIATKIADITVTTAQYATYYNATSAYIMPEGLEGITVEGVTKNNTLTLETRYEAGDVVPVGEALVLHATEELTEATEFTLYAGTATSSKVAANMLKGTSTAEEETTGGDKYYRLSQHDGQVGFYWGAAEGAAFQPGANKAYLAVSGTNAPARFIFGQQDVPTELQNVSAEAVSRKVVIDGRLYIVRDGNMFDLNGRLVK